MTSAVPCGFFGGPKAEGKAFGGANQVTGATGLGLTKVGSKHGCNQGWGWSRKHHGNALSC